MEQLITDFARDMDTAIPWNEYPRPSMVRDSFFCLNGKWDFALTGGEEPQEYTDKILVPFPPESYLSGFNRSVKCKTMYYRRTFTLPEGFCGEGDRVLLHFGAVDQVADVFLNGRHIMHHEGGYLPFHRDVAKHLVEGENTLVVKAVDKLNKKYPYGKQKKNRGGMWYTTVSGIWQTVWMEAVPHRYIDRLFITTTDRSATISVDYDGEKVLTLESGEEYVFGENKITITPENPKKWSPESPFVYNFTLKCGDDCVNSYFALRKIETKIIDKIPRLCLNGEPYVFTGLLDQGYYPDGIFLPATSEGYRYDIQKCKELGFNMLRKHIKVEPEIFYYLCDKLGMVVFQDMVNNSSYSFLFDTALPTIGMKRFPDKILHTRRSHREFFVRHMNETMYHLQNFPSILYYTIFNEGWGQFCSDKIYRIAKHEDGTRIIDSASGWFAGGESDVDSRHVYFKPVRIFGKARKRPIVISEFGGYSYRVEGHLFGDANYGYTSVDSMEAFEDKFVALYENEILPLIPRGISALVYTQVSDVEDETNGIMTYDRKVVKLSPERIRPLMEKIKAKALGNK